MKTKTINIEVPESIDEKAFIEFALVYVKRHITAEKEAERQIVEEAVEVSLDEVKSANGLKTRAELEVKEEVKPEEFKEVEPVEEVKEVLQEEESML
jgi:hypothetical protein